MPFNVKNFAKGALVSGAGFVGGVNRGRLSTFEMEREARLDKFNQNQKLLANDFKRTQIEIDKERGALGQARLGQAIEKSEQDIKLDTLQLKETERHHREMEKAAKEREARLDEPKEIGEFKFADEVSKITTRIAGGKDAFEGLSPDQQFKWRQHVSSQLLLGISPASITRPQIDITKEETTFPLIGGRVPIIGGAEAETLFTQLGVSPDTTTVENQITPDIEDLFR